MGEHKAGIIREAAEGPLTDRVPASLSARASRRHRCWLDAAAAGKLTGVATPWVLGQRRMDRRADQAGRALALRAKPARPC